jgi:hypothetical protein
MKRPIFDRPARSFASDNAMTPALDRLQRNLLAQYGAAFPDAKPSGLRPEPSSGDSHHGPY